MLEKAFKQLGQDKVSNCFEKVLKLNSISKFFKDKKM